MAEIASILSIVFLVFNVFKYLGLALVSLIVLAIVALAMRKSIIKYITKDILTYISQEKYDAYVDMVSEFVYYVVLRYPLAPFAVFFFSTPDKRHLTRFKDMETVDWDLAGDTGWREEHLIGSDPLSFINRVRWLWRNGYAGKAYNEFGVKLSTVTITETPTNIENLTIVTTDQKYFLYRKFVKTGSKYTEYFFGWSLKGPQEVNGEKVSKLVCTIRKRTNTN